MKKFLYIAVMTLLLASCTEDFKDWANPQSNPQGEVVTFGTGSVASVGVIDFALIPDTVKTVKVCDITSPGSNYETYNPEYYIYLNGQPFVLDLDGYMDAKELDCFVEADQTGNGKYSLPCVSASASEKNGRYTVTLANLSMTHAEELTLRLDGWQGKACEARILTEDVHAFNTFEQPNRVTPQIFDLKPGNDCTVQMSLPPCSLVSAVFHG